MRDNRYTDGSYLAHNPGWGVEDAPYKVSFIRRLMEKNNINASEVIEIGCGAGGILQMLSQDKNIRLLKGYDISPQAIALAADLRSEKVHFYNEDILARDDYHTDLLLVIDVIEHVDDFYKMLNTIRYRSDHFIFHIPLDLCCRTVLKPHVLLQQRQSVGHIHYFTRDMVEWILQDTGYQIVDWMYTGSMSDRGLDKTFKGGVKKILRRISYFLNKDLSVKLWGGYSMMILAK
jgi:SAM-dependent methyltransferase